MVSYNVVDGALEVRHRHEVIRIQAWGADSVRVRAAQHRLPVESHGALELSPPGQTGQISIDGTSACLTTGRLRVEVDFDTAAAYPEPLLTFRTADGEVLLAEQREHFWMPGARVYTGNRTGAYEIHQEFAAHPGERLFGLGQRTHGRLNLKGLALDLVQRNGEVNIPFVLSSRGYGLLWNVPAVGRVEFAENATRWQAGQAREIDYWFTAAPTPADILARYADATGHVPELPEWASGFWQSKLRYRTQEELLAVAREYKRRGLPLSVIVSDFFHWSAMGDYRFDENEWPDPDAMVAELNELGVQLMVSVWPTVSPLSENYDTYYDRGLLVGADQGVEFQQTIQDKGMAAPQPVAFYDPTNPATREYVWGLVKDNYLSRGIRVFWLDASEPELNPAQPGNLSLYAGPGAETINIYPRDNARLFAEGMAAAGQEPTVLLCRSAWAGSQKYGAAVWSGDIPATWESLRQQLRAGLSIAISGIPWWTTDIGGFHGGNPADPAYQELMVRWFQYGVFCPLFRLHGDRQPRVPTGYAMTGGPNEVWSYGENAYPHLTAALSLRERLRPYIHRQMHEAATVGMPPMRPLFVDLPDDARAWAVEDQFLFGPDLLIAPVLRPGAREREVYLPAGRTWVDAATGQQYPGGQSVTAATPIDHIPVYVTEGSEVLNVIR
ncbi:glycoside hydrolase family 31 protein [Rugosimonospora acidiphila]|uniref:Glycoside hydrolase family 31 protein n=1 Tax=Rugosimonospora acidiphila TaxID=556531 RepID=A0ABP9RUT8_9ACTN